MKDNTKIFIDNNWKYFVIFIMLGIVMYWSAIIIDPVLQIAKNQLAIGKIGIAQNERIMQILTNDTTTNNTKDIVANIIGNTTN
jgi:hypothetical protein